MANTPESIATEVRRVFRSTLWIIIASVIWTIVLPGLVAMWDGVFYSQHVPLPGYAEKRLESHEDTTEELKNEIAQIDDRIAEQTNPEMVKALLLLREKREKQLAAEAAPISRIGFHLNPQLLMWPAIYSCLLWLIFVFPPAPDRISLRAAGTNERVLGFGTLIYAVYQWPTWVRNMLPEDPSRRVFAYPNWDIDPRSFILQELIVFVFAMLLAALWLQAADYYAEKTAETERHEEERRQMSELTVGREVLKEALDSKLVNDVASMFGEWQVRSIVLGLGFIFFTNFFWNLVAKFDDQRYLVSAVMVHVLWGISWTAISIPVVTRWRYWLRVKRAALVDLSLHDRIGDEPAKREIIASTRPFSEFGFSLASAASLASFFLPILKAFI
jgi:uncharacterized membrane protein